MTAMLRRISDQISDQAPNLRRLSDRVTNRAAAGYGTVREHPKASAAIVAGATLVATAIWLMTRYQERARRRAVARPRSAAHGVRRRGSRVRAGRAAA